MPAMECAPGYFGVFCNKPCLPGRFGTKCGGNCFPECKDEDCDSVKGCKKYERGSTQISVSDEMTKEEIIQTITLSSTMPIIWPKSEPNIKSNATYILAGTVISVLLFILVLQSCKKSRSIQKNNINKERKNEAKVGYASSNRFQHVSDGPCSKRSCIKSGCSHQIESEYDEISECLRFVQAPVFLNDFESSNTAPGDVNELSCTDKPNLNADDSEFYLQPVFSHGNKQHRNTEEIHQYIDIID